MPAPVASGGSESPGGPCTHWKAPPCHGARGKPTFGFTPCEVLRRGGAVNWLTLGSAVRAATGLPCLRRPKPRSWPHTPHGLGGCRMKSEGTHGRNRRDIVRGLMLVGTAGLVGLRAGPAQAD